MKNRVKIKYHGVLGEQLKRNEFNLNVKSVAEGLHATNTKLHGNLYKNLMENDKKNIKYQVLINGSKFLYDKEIYKKDNDPNKLNTMINSELTMNKNDLKSIDIIPVLEGQDSDVWTVIAGVILIIIGIILVWTGIGAYVGVALITSGIGLVAAGVINLLSPPPKFEDFRGIEGGGNVSYLFNGPQNTVGEGGPVPLVFGRLRVGSHAVAASYNILPRSAANELTV